MIDTQLELCPCPKCGSNDSNIILSTRDYYYHIPGEYFISQCQHCSFWFQNPRPTSLLDLYPIDYTAHISSVPSQIEHNKIRDFLRLVYNSYFYRHLGYNHLRDRRLRGIWPVLDCILKRQYGIDLTPAYVPNGKLLDIGCGSGSRLSALFDLGWQHLYGIELVSAVADNAKKKGISIEYGIAEDILPKYPDKYFDVVISSMVLEHLSNPFNMVRDIASKVKPNGQFLFSTVSRDSLDAKVYGAYWGGFDLPRHMVHFRKRDIYNMIEPYFKNVEFFHQGSPIDFVRASTWRGKKIDHIILPIAKSLIGNMIGIILSWLNLTTRISFRCTRKDNE